jgi:hypothetical protein
MGYVIAAILVLLIVAAGVTFFVLNATRTGRRQAAADSDHSNEAAIVAPDEQTPLGDTDQHAGEQTREGTTVSQPESGGATTSGSAPPAGTGGVGGESEGGRPVVPESERLADRPR